MATKKTGLGKGLDSLITNKVNKTDSNQNSDTGMVTEKVIKNDTEFNDNIFVDINKVEPNRSQPRKKFDEDGLIELSESIKLYGIIQPLIVQKKEDYFEIIAGERRWRAAKIAELKKVPVIIKDITDQEKMEISLIENIQRENLNPIEEALAYKQLLNDFHLKQDEVAERVSKSRTAVTNALRLLKLDNRVQQMVIDEMITTGHARTLISIEDEESQYKLALKIFDEKLSVRETEKLIKETNNEKNKNKKRAVSVDERTKNIYADLEEQMKRVLGTKVAIHYKNQDKGKLEIEYYSQNELDRIVELIRSIRD